MKNLFLVFAILLYAGNVYANGKFIDYMVGDEEFQGYFIAPAKDAPLIIMVHDWDGLTDYEVKRAGMLSELGYTVFAVDLFGKGIRPVETAEKKKLIGSLYSNRERMRKLLKGGFDKAIALGGNRDNSVAMGYCFGGAATLEFARTGIELKGFVSFHGILTTPENQDYSSTKGKILVLHGTADNLVTMEHFAKLANDLEKLNIQHEMVTYSGAPHAFTVFGSNRYREDADKKSWRRFTEFLDETL